MIFSPPRTRGASIAGALAALALVLGLALLLRGFTLHVSFAAALGYTLGAILLTVAVPLGYWAYAAANLRYELRKDALAIHWGFVEHLIPLREIQRVVLGRHLPVPAVSGLRLPGVAVGSAHVNKIGDATIYMRYRGPEDVLYLMTGSGPIGLALRDSQPFIRAMQQAEANEGGVTTGSGLRRGAFGSFGFLSDRLVLTLGAAALLSTWLTVMIVFSRFQRLPATVTVHFPSTQVAHLAPRDRLLQIPESAVALLVIAALAAVLLFNRARIASYLVLGGAAFSGALLLIAAIGATG